jgi:hypothetical protein
MVANSYSETATALQDDHHLDFDVFTSNRSDIIKPTKNTEHDFIWSLKEEPHFSRRKEILKKYPEIQKLFGHEPLTKWIILGIVAVQFLTAYTLSFEGSYKTPLFWILAYVIGNFHISVCVISDLLLRRRYCKPGAVFGHSRTVSQFGF